MITDSCPYCGAAGESINPYEATPAVIDAAPPPAEQAAPQDYNVRFGPGETIGETFSLWTRALAPLFLLNLIPAIPILLLIIGAVVLVVTALSGKFAAFTSSLNPDDLSNLFTGFGAGLIVALVFIFIAIFVCVLPAVAGQFRILDDQARAREPRTGVFAAYLWGFRFILPFLGFTFVIYLAIVAAVLVGIPLAQLSIPLVVAWAIAMTVLAVIAGARLTAAIPIMVIESKSIFAAMAASNRLTAGRTLKVVGAWFVFFFVLSGVGMGLGVVALIPILGQIAAIAGQLLLTPLQAAFTFAVYAGLTCERQREEITAPPA